MSKGGKSGFTLVELAVVLVIIGLVIGGIMAANELMIAAKNRKIIREAEGYKQAVLGFVSKYNGLPGDMPNPARYWGTPASGWGIMCCKGDRTIVWTHEGPEAWMMLGMAGLVPPMNIDNTSNCGFLWGDGGILFGCRGAPGVNMPVSVAVPGAGWTIGVAMTAYQTKTRTNMLMLGFGTGGANTLADGPVLSPMNSYYLDSKVDDGTPHTGLFRARRSYVASGTPSCDTDRNTNAYVLSGTDANITSCTIDLSLTN
jgi:prepilin-type N-terminal cleavage/methylation domain-containing protein